MAEFDTVGGCPDDKVMPFDQLNLRANITKLNATLRHYWLQRHDQTCFANKTFKES
ncbi:hypothetical protein [Bifidobacterium polysaccharolyticum]|uniref:hypothetical protein n=1 Tax=Bifidobacterium polysaccharolyticum TaxID=2750967 RepID=UPI000B331487